MEQWNKELERKILRKSRFDLTLRIFRVVLTIILVYSLYSLFIGMFADWFHKTKEHHYYTALATEWTLPNIRAEFTNGEGTINSFGVKRSSNHLYKVVGKENKYAGTMNITRRYSNDMSLWQIDFPIEKLKQLNFSLPEDPRNGKKLEANSAMNVWNILDKLPEGTVAEVGFSTTSFMKPEELLQVLEKYDLNVLWMPLYAGEFNTYKPGNYSSGGNTITLYGGLGLTGGRTHNTDFSSYSVQTVLSLESLQDSKKEMLQNMNEMLQKGSDYYQRFLGLQKLEEQYNYLTENGFQVYGAVVTGPTKELLKLKDLSFIQGKQLGEVELWNWE